MIAVACSGPDAAVTATSVGARPGASFALTPVAASPTPAATEEPLRPALRIGRTFASVPQIVGDPPDPTIAVSADTILVATNSEVALHTKDGAFLARTRLSKFVVPPNRAERITDPRAIFDQSSSRFFLVAAATHEAASCGPGTCLNHLLLAVSRGASPRTLDAASWYFYVFDNTLEDGRPTATWGDAHKLTVTSRHLVISGMMDAVGQPRNLYAKIWIFDKGPLLDGVAPRPRTFHDLRDPTGNGPVFAIMPAVEVGPSDVAFFVARHFSGGGCGLILWRLDLLAANAAPEPRVVDGVGPCGQPAPLAQQGGPPLDPGDRLTSPAFLQDGTMWVAEAVSSSPSEPSAVRIAQIDVRSWPSISARFTVVRSSAGLAYPAIAGTRGGALAFVAARSGPRELPSISYAFLGTTWSAPLTLRTSEAPFTATGEDSRIRYGDYFSIVPDPDGRSLWLFAEYVAATGRWATVVGELSAAP